ncbi:MAG: hypothetical protein K9I36_15845 [Bacteroidia bacterium]|nr:hypothetical protein [Bacteroidia bacterium]
MKYIFSRIYLTLLCSVMSGSVFAQTNFLKLNLGGLLYSQTFDKELRPLIPPTFSLGFEKGLKNSNYSIGCQINYGYTLFSMYTETDGYKLAAKVAYQGVSLFLDARKYICFSNAGKLKSDKYEGVFAGVYGGFQKLNENQFVNYDPINHDIQNYYLNESEKIWILGLGLNAGYKKSINNNFYFEILGGLGYGYVSKAEVQIWDSYGNSKIRALNLTRAEFSVGYKF